MKALSSVSDSDRAVSVNWLRCGRVGVGSVGGVRDGRSIVYHTYDM